MNDHENQLSPEASELLSELRGADDPSGADRARVRKALMATVAGGAGLAASTAASTAAAATATGATAATGVSFGVKVAAVVFALGAIGTTAVVVPGLIETETPREVSASVSPAVRVVEPAREPSPAAPETRSEPPVLAPVDTVLESPPEVAPAAAEPRARPARTPRSPVVEAPPEPSAPSSLSVEVALLHRAQRAIQAERPHDALRILGEHASRFPSGQLDAEREAARVVALCDAGRREEARGLAERFLRTRPGHPLAARVRAACP